jgi:2-iminobutanoate/2-iminopropanoate deaminase
MQKRIITSEKAPQPIGPYSQAVLVNGMLYCSGQVAIDVISGEMVQENIAAETHQVMKNIEALLKEAGMDLSHIIKSSIFLSDMQLFQEVNKVYGSYFSGNFPARETVAVKELPRKANVEISVIAVK